MNDCILITAPMKKQEVISCTFDLENYAHLPAVRENKEVLYVLEENKNVKKWMARTCWIGKREINTDMK